jgi:hypothetical protein
MSFSKNIESVEIFDVEGQGGILSCPYRSQHMMYRILFESGSIQFDLGRSSFLKWSELHYSATSFEVEKPSPLIDITK